MTMNSTLPRTAHQTIMTNTGFNHLNIRNPLMNQMQDVTSGIMAQNNPNPRFEQAPLRIMNTISTVNQNNPNPMFQQTQSMRVTNPNLTVAQNNMFQQAPSLRMMNLNSTVAQNNLNPMFQQAPSMR